MRRQPPRLVLLGDTSVGKTSLVNRLITEVFEPTTVATTAASYIMFKAADSEAQDMQIWDTAGAEQFKAIGSIYYRNAAGGILVCDVTSRKTFESLDGWYNEFKKACPENFVIYVAANKCDREDSMEVSEDEVTAWCDAHEAKGFMTSAVTGANVRQMFVSMSKDIPQLRQSTAVNEVLQVEGDGHEPGPKCC